MAEEITNEAIVEESPMAESPLAETPLEVPQEESASIETTSPPDDDKAKRMQAVYKMLDSDAVYYKYVPKTFDEFITKIGSDVKYAQGIHKMVASDEVYSKYIPATFEETVQYFGLGKPSAVPSVSVGGGSATKGRGVEQPSTSLPRYQSFEELEASEKSKAALPSEQTISVKREEVKQKANMPSAKVIAETTPEMLAEGQQRIIKREAERALFEEKAKQGNFLGMLQNSLIEGFTSTVNNTADLTLYLMSLGGIGVSPEYDAASNQEKARIFSEALDDVGIKKTLDKQLKTASTTQEYTQKRTEEGGPIMEGVVGLAGSAFPMFTPQQSGFFINGFVDSKKEIQEAMPELSPWKQAAYAFTQGAVQVALERAGLSNLIQNKSITRALSGKVMDAMKTTFGKFTAKEADVFATKVVNAFFAEAETGATQYAVQEGLRQLADALEGEDDKFEFEGSEQFLSNIMKSGISEGVGGVIMKSMAELPKMIKSPLKKKEAAAVNAQTEQLAADIQNPNVSPEAKVAIDKQINDNAEDVAKAYAEDLNKYEALPEESKADLNRINEDIISHEAVLNDPNVSPETKAISEQRIQELEEQGEGILDSAPVTEIKAPSEAQPTPQAEAAPQEKGEFSIQGTFDGLKHVLGDPANMIPDVQRGNVKREFTESNQKGKKIFTLKAPQSDNFGRDGYIAVSLVFPETTTKTIDDVKNALDKKMAEAQAAVKLSREKGFPLETVLKNKVSAEYSEPTPTTEPQAPVAEEAKGESGVEGDVESRTNKLESKLSDFENNTRSQSTKDLIAWAEDIFDTKFEGDFNKGEYISFFNSLGDKGYEAARYLQNPKKALSILKESPVYLAKLAGQSIPTQEAQAPVAEEAKGEAEAIEEKKAEPSIDNVAQNAGISPKNIRDLYKVNRELFSLNQVKALASAVAMDRMIGVMAKRAGVTKAEMYGRLKFEKASEQDLPQGVKMQVDAWHGSPYEFDKFQTAFMGKGEGAQAFGWGLYFTDLKNIAKSYAKSLAKATFKGEALDESPFFEKLFIGLDADNESFYNYETGQITNLDEFKKYIDDMYESMLAESKEIDSNNKIVQRLLSDTEYADSKIEEAKKNLRDKRSFDTRALYDTLIKNGVPDKDAKSLIDSFSQSREGDKRFLYEASKYKASRETKLNKAIQFVKNQNKSDLNYFKFLKDNFDKFNLSRNLYKVTLHEGKSPNQYTWLEWDRKPSKEQVKELFNNLTQEQLDKGFYYGVKPDATNADIYKGLSKALGSDKKASLFLLENGIDGIKYPAESVSRGATSGTARGFNYVVFDENAVSIEEVIKFQKDVEKARGAMMITLDGQATIYALTDPNVSTPLHELAHVFEHYLTDGEKKAVMDAANTKEWNTKTSEYFARGFEKYLAEGKSPIAALDKVFAKFKEWLTDIYNGILGSDIDIELNDEMRNIYAQMLGKEIANKPASKKTSIFDDFDTTNKRTGLKGKVEANKAFREKYGEDAAVAKAISSNFEAIADELKAKGIFTKIEC